MSTYFTSDFADFSTCSAGDCGDWTERFNTGYWAVSSGNIAYPSGKSIDWTAVSWDDIDGDANRANTEVLLKLTASATLSGARHVFMLRGTGSDESEAAYVVTLKADALRTYYVLATSATQIATYTITISQSTTYWIRFRVNGASPTTVQARIWADGSSEPGTWTLDSTDSSGPQSAGLTGPAVYGTSTENQHTLLQLGVGTNGDTAPSTAPVTGITTGARNLLLLAAG